LLTKSRRPGRGEGETRDKGKDEGERKLARWRGKTLEIAGR